MPEIHFVGEIKFLIADLPAASITWAIVAGSDAWSVRNGLNYGETHIVEIEKTSSRGVLSHPIDVHFQTSSFEGNPVFIFELWDRSYDELKSFRGCGSVFLPCLPGRHNVEVNAWMPVSHGLKSLREMFLPVYPDLHGIRELSMSPYLRNEYQCEHAGSLQLTIFTTNHGFD